MRNIKTEAWTHQHHYSEDTAASQHEEPKRKDWKPSTIYERTWFNVVSCLVIVAGILCCMWAGGCFE